MEAIPSIPAPILSVLLAACMEGDPSYLDLKTGSFWPKSDPIPLTRHANGSLRQWQTPASMKELPREIFALPTSLVMSESFHPQRLFNFCMPVVEFDNFGKTEHGVGRGLQWQKSHALAYMEAWERYCGMTPPDPSVKFVSYQKLAAQSMAAVNPRSLLLPLQRSSQNTYADDRDIAWVEGYSHSTQQPILVPARAVYTDFSDDFDWLTGSSNGLAMGGTNNEALFYGLLELIERDAFLRTWYGSRPTDEIFAESVSPDITLVVDHLASQGYRARFFRLDTQIDFVAVWCLIQNVEGQGPYSVSGASCHPDAKEAMFAALMEAAGTLGSMGRYYDPKLGSQLLLAPESVNEPVDHFQMYAVPDAAEHLAFLFQGLPKTYEQAFPRQPAWANCNNLDDLLVYTMKQLGRIYPDIISIDLSRATEDFPFRVARVVVPGLLPMTHGHAEQRLPANSIEILKNVPHPFS